MNMNVEARNKWFSITWAETNKAQMIIKPTFKIIAMRSVF